MKPETKDEEAQIEPDKIEMKNKMNQFPHKISSEEK